ncbi:MAG: serine dehydratase subunit alpha family protein [Sphaerochaetaceae bacterium]|nr:serine dehydratase subunit alpha family protein [Sphaerochaetaceae bacterium]
MDKNSIIYETYVEILKRELVCAMGCTEPIAIAFASSKARSVLGCIPEKVVVEVSGNIVKNVKCVIVPNTGGKCGIEAATAIGIVAGNHEAGLQVVSEVTPQDIEKLDVFMAEVPISVKAIETPYLLDVSVKVIKGSSSARVRIINEHTNVVLVEKDEKIIEGAEPSIEIEEEEQDLDYTLLSINDIYDFATTCDTEDVRKILERQIAMNSAIANEGLIGNYGACIGKTLLNAYGYDVKIRARALAAAGSDARMNGCELPVVINSGSGNQGLSASIPVIEYAKELQVSKETLLRALLISNLMTLREKNEIGRLSAYCGAVSAGAGAGAGITFLLGGSKEDIANTIVNALAITSGIVCDGAKSSCAAKIAAAVEAGILGGEMVRNGRRFQGGDGLVKATAEESIASFGRLGRIGMKETDKEIIKIMTE